MISITSKMHQQLSDRRDGLEKRLVEMQGDLNLFHEEKDPSGNSSLCAAQTEIARLEGKISELKEVLSDASIVDYDNDCVTVTVGKRVVVHMTRKGCDCDEVSEPEQLKLVVEGVNGFANTDELVITPESPIGKAIIGATAGEERHIVGPHGDVVRVVVVSIEPFA